MARCANELYAEMRAAIAQNDFQRQVSDPLSPCRETVAEAEFGARFVLRDISKNIPGNRGSVDVRWALANLLHFFASTERASALLSYNKHAARFLTGDLWRGAYGAAAMPAVRSAAEELRKDAHTRRAIVTMPDVSAACDINRPACWSSLHFMFSRGKLNMLCYQRSMNLHGVMPYDCVVLTNVLNYVAWKAGLPAGALHWHFGSLHDKLTAPPPFGGEPACDCLLPVDVLDDPRMCEEWLTAPQHAAQPWREVLTGGLTA